MSPSVYITYPLNTKLSHLVDCEVDVSTALRVGPTKILPKTPFYDELMEEMRIIVQDNDIYNGLKEVGLKFVVHQYPNDTLFVSPQLVAPLRGGKGGFGALLKAVGKRAGKKKTTDYGACRDLNGRRLRHVNDEVRLDEERSDSKSIILPSYITNHLPLVASLLAIPHPNPFCDSLRSSQIKLERWKREEKRKKDKLPAGLVEDSITASGIDNWHLGVPTWSEGVSNKERYKNKKRKFNERRREETYAERLTREKEERRNEEQKKVMEYAQQDSEVGLESSEFAMMLKVQKTRKHIKEGKLKKLFSEVPGSNVTWGKAGVVIGAGGEGKEDCCFSTVYLTPPSTSAVTGRYYYEVMCETVDKDDADIPLQVGYLTPTSLPDPNNQDGVGDVKGSVGFDGGRGLLFIDGFEKEEDGAVADVEGEDDEDEGKISWESNDIVGVVYDAGERSVQYTLNGSVLPKVKAEGVGGKMVVGISINPGGEVRVRIGEDEMDYLPEGCRPVGDLLLVTGGDQAAKKRKLGGEADDEEGKKEEGEADRKAAPPAAAVAATTTTVTAATTTVTTTTATTTPVTSASPLTIEEILKAYTQESLSALPLDTLKATLQALGLKAGGSAAERAKRLWVVKDLKREDIPGKMRDKKVFDQVTAIVELRAQKKS